MYKARQKFTSHKNRTSDANPRFDAEGKRIEFRLTYGEWYDIWESSGKWSERGTGKGAYCMARHNDLGHYEVGNVAIITIAENTRFASTGRTFTHTAEAKKKIGAEKRSRIVTAETRAKMSKSATGVACKEETKRKLSEHNKGRPMNRVSCDVCGFETSPQNLSRHKRANH